MMREIILASHGALASGMADTARMIIGDDPHLSTLALLPGSHPDCLKRQIEERLAAGTADEFLILTDLWGGSVNNALLALTQDPRVHIIAGMNLNLVLQLCLSPEPLAQAIPAALAEARQGMIYGNAVLACPQTEDELF